MAIISGVGTPLTVPANNTSENGNTNVEAAQTNETTTGMTEASDSTRETAVSAQSSTQSIVQAKVEILSDNQRAQGEASTREGARAAQAAYQIQSFLDALDSTTVEIKKLIPVAAPEPNKTEATFESEGLPV